MGSTSIDTITIMIDRQKKPILVDQIMYAEVDDKRCTLTLTHQETLSFFMTIRSLKDKLPASRFIQISRSNLVALQYIHRLDDMDVILSDGTRLPYSRRQKTSIINALHSYLSAQVIAKEATNWKSKLSTEFQCLDHCPVPFFVTEAVQNTKKHYYDPIIRYANESFAEYVGLALYLLTDQSLHQILKGRAEFLANTTISIALTGETLNQPIWLPFSDVPIHYAGYRPHYGFCASFLIPIRTDWNTLLPPPSESHVICYFYLLFCKKAQKKSVLYS